MTQNDPENDKKFQKIPNFTRFYSIFVNFRYTSCVRVLKMLYIAQIQFPVGFLIELIAGFKMKNISNWHRNRQKSQNFTIIKIFLKILSPIWQTSLTGMLKTFPKVRICSPVVFYGEIIAVLYMKNVSNWHHNWQKTQNFPFSKLFIHFCQTFDRLRESECWNGQQRKSMLSSMLQWKDKCSFLNWETSEIDIEKDRISKYFRFAISFLFSSNYRYTSWTRMLNHYTMEKVDDSASFRQEMNSICNKKCLKLTKKMSKILKFLSFLMQFLYNFREAPL